MDTIRSGAVIAGRGSLYKSEDFTVYSKGVRSIGTHLLSGKYDMAIAGNDAVQVMYLAASVYANMSDFNLELDIENYDKEHIQNPEFAVLSPLKKINKAAFAYLVEAFKII